jgi:hypothetical protein
MNDCTTLTICQDCEAFLANGSVEDGQGGNLTEQHSCVATTGTRERLMRHPTLRWNYGGWHFVLTAGSSFLLIYEHEGDHVPYDVAHRPPRRLTNEMAFKSACVKWLIQSSPAVRQS